MIDIEKHIAHWRAGAEEDLIVASDLIERTRIRHGLFFAHLSLEKILKALVCKVTGDLAPPIHNLIRLVEKAGLEIQPSQQDLLAEVNEFNIEGRYPELQLPLPTIEEAEQYLDSIKEITEWLKIELER